MPAGRTITLGRGHAFFMKTNISNDECEASETVTVDAMILTGLLRSRTLTIRKRNADATNISNDECKVSDSHIAATTCRGGGPVLSGPQWDDIARASRDQRRDVRAP